MKHYKNISQLVTLKSAFEKDGRNLLPDDLSIINNASVVFDDNEIIWIGESKLLPKNYDHIETFDLSGKTVLPEIVDCHTHLVFGGNRAREYSMRLNGADYQEIAKIGGGILSTMKATQKEDHETLFRIACERVERINSYGVGTIEIKSGYGLTFEKEYEISHIIDRLKKHFAKKVQIKNTFMAAHAVPQDYKNSSEYLDTVVIPLLKKLSNESILDAVDIFHEKGYFNDSDVRRLFEAATQIGLPVKSHADEFVDGKGAILACEFEALSTDHLLRTGADGIEALSKSNTVATLLPGTGYFLGKPQAKARDFLDKGCKVAIASDYNPGSCHCDNLLLIASFSAPEYRMNIAELWSAITLNAAHALGLKKQGALVQGLHPRFCAFNVPQVDEITYNWGRQLSVSLP